MNHLNEFLFVSSSRFLIIRVQQIQRQNADAQCVLCAAQEETRDHLYFSCPYSQRIWMVLTKNLLGNRFTTDLECSFGTFGGEWKEWKPSFLTQICVSDFLTYHMEGKEWNETWETHQSADSLSRYIDKVVRNRISSLRLNGSRHYEGTMQAWFASKMQSSLLFMIQSFYQLQKGSTLVVKKKIIA